MSEPKDKNSYDWLDWYVRHQIGGSCAEAIKTAIKKGMNAEKFTIWVGLKAMQTNAENK